MAFRASRKPALPKTSKKTTKSSDVLSSPVDTVESSTPISVDDLIGAPVSQSMPEPVQPKARIVKEEPRNELPLPPAPVRPTPQNDAPPSFSPSQQQQPPQQQSQQSFHNTGYAGNSYGNGNGGNGNGGNGGGGYGGGYRNRYGGGGGGGGHRRVGMRRDFTPTDNGYTQDINVPTETVKGILDVMPEGHGFLRPKFTPSDRDIYISQSQIRRFLLRNGDMVEGQARQPKENERYWGLLKVEKINGRLAEEMTNRPKFEDLTPIYPNKLLKLETGKIPLSTRIIDLVAPIGFGQRGLIVSPPKAGKTTIIKELAAGIAANFPEVHLMAALIGERPEEVTDITRSVNGEVIPRMCVRALAGEAPLIFGTGEQTRDFTYISDTIKGILLASEHDALLGDVVNIAYGQEVSILQVAQAICKATGIKTPVTLPARPNDVMRHAADTTKAKKLLGWKPEIDVDHGIHSYVAWLKKTYPDPKSLLNRIPEKNW